MSFLNRDFFLEIKKGNVPGHRPYDKFGKNFSIDTGTVDDIWSGGGVYGFYPDSAQPMEIVSGLEQDTLTFGGGAWTCTVEGLDNNFDIQSETVNLNGTNVVSLTNTYTRVYRTYVTNAGSIGSNVGQITCRIQSNGTVASIISSATNQTLMAIYTIPRNEIGLLNSFYGTTGKGKDAEIILRTRRFGEVFQYKRTVDVFENSYIEKFMISLAFPPKTDIKLSAQTDNNGTPVKGGFHFMLVKSTAVNSSNISFS